jgi:hypothetical protein
MPNSVPTSRYAAGVLRGGLDAILARLATARPGEPLGRGHELRGRFESLRRALAACDAVRACPTIRVEWSAGKGALASVPSIVFLDVRETKTAQRGLHAALLFREDASGVYLALIEGTADVVARLKRAAGRRALAERAARLGERFADLASAGFALEGEPDLRTRSPLGVDYQRATVAHKLYETGAVPPDDAIEQDLATLLQAYTAHVAEKTDFSVAREPAPDRPKGSGAAAAPDAAERVEALVAAVAARGFAFEPWQIAAYVTALRTKPFAILAGVSGTGKSRLPSLVAEATGGAAHLLPVRPDWTDSSDVIGYTDLQGRFRPGPLLEIARDAAASPRRHTVCVLDEMNLARVEHYFAEVLSRIEARDLTRGPYASAPLVAHALAARDAAWGQVGLPANLAIVGTVNMDESTHGFSRKVLDRAFTIELSDVDLAHVEAARPSAVPARPWPIAAWRPRAMRLGALGTLEPDEAADVARAVETLVEANALLSRAQLHAGYRTRDEVALFLLHARDAAASFVARDGEPVDPLDLALQMKLLPRIAGGSGAVRRVVLGMLGWAVRGKPFEREEESDRTLDAWASANRPSALARARFPRTAARLCLMWERVVDEGFTSFWT